MKCIVGISNTIRKDETSPERFINLQATAFVFSLFCRPKATSLEMSRMRCGWFRCGGQTWWCLVSGVRGRHKDRCNGVVEMLARHIFSCPTCRAAVRQSDRQVVSQTNRHTYRKTGHDSQIREFCRTGFVVSTPLQLIMTVCLSVCVSNNYIWQLAKRSKLAKVWTNEGASSRCQSPAFAKKSRSVWRSGAAATVYVRFTQNLSLSFCVCLFLSLRPIFWAKTSWVSLLTAFTESIDFLGPVVASLRT